MHPFALNEDCPISRFNASRDVGRCPTPRGFRSHDSGTSMRNQCLVVLVLVGRGRAFSESRANSRHESRTRPSARRASPEDDSADDGRMNQPITCRPPHGNRGMSLGSEFAGAASEVRFPGEGT
jgi:hypothetical protein